MTPPPFTPKDQCVVTWACIIGGVLFAVALILTDLLT